MWWRALLCCLQSHGTWMSALFVHVNSPFKQKIAHLTSTFANFRYVSWPLKLFWVLTSFSPRDGSSALSVSVKRRSASRVVHLRDMQKVSLLQERLVPRVSKTCLVHIKRKVCGRLCMSSLLRAPLTCVQQCTVTKGTLLGGHVAVVEVCDFAEQVVNSPDRQCKCMVTRLKWRVWGTSLQCRQIFDERTSFTFKRTVMIAFRRVNVGPSIWFWTFFLTCRRFVLLISLCFGETSIRSCPWILMENSIRLKKQIESSGKIGGKKKGYLQLRRSGWYRFVT